MTDGYYGGQSGATPSMYDTTTFQQGVRAINNLADAVLNATMFMNGYGAGQVKALGTLLSTTATQIIAADQNRVSLVFHNPSTSVTLYVYPQTDINGATLSPVSTTPAGSFTITPQGYLQFFGPDGACQKAWFAVSSTGSTSQPITIMSI